MRSALAIGLASVLITAAPVGGQERICVVQSLTLSADWYYVTDQPGVSGYSIAFTSAREPGGMTLFLAQSSNRADLTATRCRNQSATWIHLPNEPTPGATWITLRNSVTAGAIPVSLVEDPKSADLSIHLSSDLPQSRELIAALIIHALKGNSARNGGEEAYLIEMGLVLDFERIRPLISGCADLGRLEPYREELLEVMDLENLRPELELLGPVEVNGCPSDIAAEDITGVQPTR